MLKRAPFSDFPAAVATKRARRLGAFDDRLSETLLAEEPDNGAAPGPVSLSASPSVPLIPTNHDWSACDV